MFIRTVSWPLSWSSCFLWVLHLVSSPHRFCLLSGFLPSYLLKVNQMNPVSLFYKQTNKQTLPPDTSCSSCQLLCLGLDTKQHWGQCKDPGLCGCSTGIVAGSKWSVSCRKPKSKAWRSWVLWARWQGKPLTGQKLNPVFWNCRWAPQQLLTSAQICLLPAESTSPYGFSLPIALKPTPSRSFCVC